MVDSIKDMYFRNASFRSAFNTALDSKTPSPPIEYNGTTRTWNVLDREFKQTDKQIHLIVSIFNRILHWIKECFVKGYASNFKKTVELFKSKKREWDDTHPAVPSAQEVEKVAQQAVTAIVPAIPVSPAGIGTKIAELSTTALGEEEGLLSPRPQEKKQLPQEYQANYDTISKYIEGDLKASGNYLKSEKPAEYDAQMQDNIAAILERTYEILEEEIAQEGSMDPIRFLNKKITFMEGLTNICNSFGGNFWKLKGRQSFIVDGAEKLKAKCAATLEYDAIVNFNPAWGYHFEGKEPKRLMIVSLKGNKLDTGEEIKLGTICEKVLKDIAADESKVGRFLKALYKLLGYAQVHKYEGLSSKLREILNKNDSTDALVAPAFELSPIQLFDSMHLIAAYQSNTDKFLFVANDALVLRPEVSSSQDQQSLLAWIQRKVEQFWELYRNSSEQRGTLLDMARSLDQGLVRLTSDYDEGYKEFSAPLREIRIKFEQKIADEQKNIVKSLREGQRKSSIFDWLATGATQFNTEKVKKCLKSSFGDALTDQAFKFSFGSSSPKENLSNGDIYFILRKISKEVEKISSAQLVQQYSLEAEGFVVGIKEA